MTTIAFYNICEDLNKNNYMFENANVSVGDDLLEPLVSLRKYAETKGITIATVDVLDLDRVEAFFFMDMPLLDNKYFNFALESGRPMYLIVCESPLAYTGERSVEGCHHFKKVFTWNDSLIDDKKYFKINYGFVLPRQLDLTALKKEKLCTLIATNHWSNHPSALYRERLEAIKWFTKYYPEQFDFYGHGWDKYRFKAPWLQVLNRKKLEFIKKFIPYGFSTYRGSLERKKPVLEKYKFAICYENFSGAPGYITEKIFDCFFAGCVPIYWGAPNISEHIPEGCYVDKRKFSRYEDLYKYINSMTDQEYSSYLRNIADFLSGEASAQFSTSRYVQVLMSEIQSLIPEAVT